MPARPLTHHDIDPPPVRIDIWEIDQDGRGPNTYYVTTPYGNGDGHEDTGDDETPDLEALLEKYASRDFDVVVHPASTEEADQ